MSSIIDPGKSARREAAKQRDLLKRERQKQALEKAKAEEEVAKKVSMALDPSKGRQSLIKPRQGDALKETLG